MQRYRIAWLPGDGIGPEVCAPGRLVLDAAGFQAEYLEGDIGWEFWKKEGDPPPQRTLDLRARTDCAFFGAITSKPAAAADRELSAELQGRGFVYRSPVVRLHQLLDLYICQRAGGTVSRQPPQLPRGDQSGRFPRKHGRHVHWGRIRRNTRKFRGESWRDDAIRGSVYRQSRGRNLTQN